MTTKLFKKLGLIALSVGFPLLMTTSANAQGPTTGAATGTEATAERVYVTGMNIPTAEEVTASPVDTLTTADIQRSGSTDVLTVLQKRNPDITGGANIGTTNANIASSTTTGGTSVQIRGFPTLVLYEGRRIADSAAIANTGNAFQFTDIGLFPTALISRLEVLKDGASAIYGSEAVGGVVNIFTKDNYQGAEVGFRYGTTVESAVAERLGWAIAGAGNETTQVVAGMQYREMDPLFARQKGYSAISDPLGGGTTNYSGSVRDADRFLPIGLNLTHPYGTPVANSPFDLGAVPGSIAPGPLGGFDALNATLTTPFYTKVASQSGFNLDDVPTSTLDTTRTNVIVSANHQIFGKQLEAFGNFLYSNSSNRSFLNGQPITLGSGLLILGSQRLIVVPNLATPDPLDTMQILVAENRGAPAPFNPFVESFDNVSAGAGPNRLVNAIRFISRPRIYDNDNNFYRFLVGLRSQINDKWFVETAAFYSKYDITFANANLPILQQVNNAIAGTGIYTGHPYDPFSIQPVGTGPGQLTPELFAALFGTNIRQMASYQRAFDGKVVGFPFELPGGPVGVSVGGEYRLEGFKLINSPEIFLGNTPVSDIYKRRSIQTVFAELNIPIVGSLMNVPGIRSLELSMAGRFDHYEGVSEDAKVPKVGLRYQPIKDLTLRATYSNSFIAPNLYQTNGPSAEAFTAPIDFGTGQGAEQAHVISGSNPNLTPSTAETYTAGLVYSPSFVPGLIISADYFRTLQQRLISAIGGTIILNDVQDNGTASQFASLVTFNNFAGRPGAQAVTGPGQLDGNLNNVFVLDVFQNLGAAHTEGVDLSARYTLELNAWGQLEFGVNALVFTLYEQKTFALNSPYYNLQNLVGGEFFGAFPDYKLTFLAEYRWNGLTLSLTAQYIPEMLSAVNEDVTGDQSGFAPVDDYFTIDGRLSYTFKGKTTAVAALDAKDAKGGKSEAVASAATMSPMQRLLDGTTLAVGCNNMLDQDPPHIIGGNSNTDLSVYDPFGQFVYFEISKKF